MACISTIEDGYCSSSISKSSYCPSDEENAIVHDLNSKVYRKDSEITKLRNLLNEKDEQLRHMRKQIDDTEKSICNSNLQNRVLDEQISRLKSKLSNDAIDREKTVSFLQSKLRSLEEQQNDSKLKFIEQISSLRTIVNDLEMKNHHLEAELEKTQILQLNNDCATRKSEVGKWLVFSSIFAALAFYSFPNFVSFYASCLTTLSSVPYQYPF